ncbi:immunity 49 family protein [Streptomyces sp. NPDC057249]|uniref:immunity 49 family protein n=1 Tax=Streptomyces sp. NPDC057249 TaxID=3346067 RepID=UPI00363336E6
MDLLRRRATGQHAEFNSALEQALRAHKAYWSADQERSDSCFGWVALAPLAMACLAADADFPIEIESDYLPRGHPPGGRVQTPGRRGGPPGRDRPGRRRGPPPGGRTSP